MDRRRLPSPLETEKRGFTPTHFVVFGGSGFIGRHLVAELTNGQGCSVTVADIEAPPYPISESVTYRHCDVRGPVPESVGPGGCTVVNLAAIHRTPGHDDNEYYETNVQGARSVVAFCEQHDVKTLWFTSSIAVYGPTESPLTECSKLAPCSAYGRSKLDAESVYAEWAARGEGRRLLIVRPAAVFGPGENGNFTRLARALRHGYFVYPGRKDTVKSCGYVKDLVNSLIFMDAQADKVTVYNFSYERPYTIEDICDTYARVANLRKPKVVIPVRAMMWLASTALFLDRVGLHNEFHPERILKLFRSTNIVPEGLRKAGFRFETDLEGGLQRWHEEQPPGEFV